MSSANKQVSGSVWHAVATSLKVWAVGLKRHDTEEADQTLRRSTLTAHQCQLLLWHPPSLPHCHSLNVQTCMQVNTLAHPPKNIHMRTLSEQFFMEIDYVGQPPLLCTAVTLTHGNRGDSFPHTVGSGFILGPGVSWSRSAQHPLFRWVKEWDFSQYVCMYLTSF